MIWDSIGHNDSQTTRWASVMRHLVCHSEALNKKASASLSPDTSIRTMHFQSTLITYAWVGLNT